MKKTSRSAKPVPSTAPVSSLRSVSAETAEWPQRQAAPVNSTESLASASGSWPLQAGRAWPSSFGRNVVVGDVRDLGADDRARLLVERIARVAPGRRRRSRATCQLCSRRNRVCSEVSEGFSAARGSPAAKAPPSTGRLSPAETRIRPSGSRSAAAVAASVP